MIALLPKSPEIERPIALVASLYRLWCKIRAPYTKQWQQNIQDTYVWERVVPGAECLKVALKRAFMTEHHKALDRTVISVLLDTSNFYDRIDLETTQQEFLKLKERPRSFCGLTMAFWLEILRRHSPPRSTFTEPYIYSTKRIHNYTPTYGLIT